MRLYYEKHCSLQFLFWKYEITRRENCSDDGFRDPRDSSWSSFQSLSPYDWNSGWKIPDCGFARL